MTAPNVLWVCTDQQRFDTLGCYGNEHVSTPVIDELARTGVRFERCFSQSPVCTPSRASFLTGRYPRTTRCRRNGQDIPASEVPVTRMLADEGYTCGLAGKLHLSSAHPDRDGDPNAERRIDDGYAEFRWSHDTGEGWPTNEYRQWLRRAGVDFERTPVRGSEYVSTSVAPEHHQTRWGAERAIDFVEAVADDDDPWLYSVNFFDPHPPYDPPSAYLDPYLDRLDEIPLPAHDADDADEPSVRSKLSDLQPFQAEWSPTMSADDHRRVRAAYWAMCDQIDDNVGRVLDALSRTGQAGSTVVVFMSDHGTMLGEHGLYQKGAYMYEPAVRVPLVVAGPGIERGVESTALVELGDIAPTLLDAASVEIPDRVQTESLWPILTGESDPDDHRDDVYSEHYDAMGFATDHSLGHGTAVRTDQYRLIRWHRLDDGELYDLAEDPDERINRWTDPEYRDVKTRLLERLTDRMFDTVDPLPERRAQW